MCPVTENLEEFILLAKASMAVPVRPCFGGGHRVWQEQCYLKAGFILYSVHDPWCRRTGRGMCACETHGLDFCSHSKLSLAF